MIAADITARRLDECSDDAEVLADASIVWALLNVLEDVHVQGDQVEIIKAARAGFVTHLSEHGLSQADLFENVVDAVEHDDFGRFGLRPPPEG